MLMSRTPFNSADYRSLYTFFLIQYPHLARILQPPSTSEISASPNITLCQQIDANQFPDLYGKFINSADLPVEIPVYSSIPVVDWTVTSSEGVNIGGIPNEENILLTSSETATVQFLVKVHSAVSTPLPEIPTPLLTPPGPVPHDNSHCHFAISSPLQFTTLLCTNCSRSFRTPRYLRRHSRIHNLPTRSAQQRPESKMVYVHAPPSHPVTL